MGCIELDQQCIQLCLIGRFSTVRCIDDLSNAAFIVFNVAVQLIQADIQFCRFNNFPGLFSRIVSCDRWFLFNFRKDFFCFHIHDTPISARKRVLFC